MTPKKQSIKPKNKEIIRKRRPINFTLDELNGSYSEDENWVSDLTSKEFEHTKKKNIKKKKSIKLKNNEIIRKRRPINFTLDDLNENDSEDENWVRNVASKGSETIKTRTLPRRNASSKRRLDDYFVTDQEEFPNFPLKTTDRVISCVFF